MAQNNGDLFSNIGQTSKILKIFTIRFFNEHKNTNISFNEFDIIHSLKNNPNIHQRGLAKILFRGTANLSKDLNSLEKKNLIKRVVDVKNNRMVKRIQLTDLGNKLYDNIGKIFETYAKSLENLYTEEEYKLFNSYLERLKNKLTESVDIVFE
ncbi:MarR family transcriptional regulator [bacterium]|nr:MarR family transcriptional regulator [bacterium]